MPRASKPKAKANSGLLTLEPSGTHKALAEFINTTVDVANDTLNGGLSPEVVALVQRAYPLYLKSPAVEAQKAAERAEREREKAEKERKRAEQVKARLDKLEEERAKLLEQLKDAPVVYTETVDDEDDEDDEEDQPGEPDGTESDDPVIEVESAEDEFVIPGGTEAVDDDDEFDSDEADDNGEADEFEAADDEEDEEDDF